MQITVDGDTILLGIFGSPIHHSKSPDMYNLCFQQNNVNAVYLAFDVDESSISAAIKAIRTLGMRGANITMPCKNKAVYSVDKLSPAAKLIGAINTVINDNGVLTGYNTDGEGFVKNLLDHQVTIKEKEITLLGAGGAGTSIAVQLALDGAKRINIFNPKDSFFDHAKITARNIMSYQTQCRVTVNDLADSYLLDSLIHKSDILVNATRVGMIPNTEKTNIKNTEVFDPNLIVADTVYAPKMTRMLKDAAAKGAKIIGGQGMLLWQGAACYELYTGKQMPVNLVENRIFTHGVFI